MRKRVLKVMAVFLAVMVAFSVLSRMIDSVNVARIKAKKTIQDEISHKIEQEVLVTHNREVPVFAESDLIVQSVHVDVGQRVEEGEILFTFSPEKLTDRQTELKREIEKTDLQMTALRNQEQVSEKQYQQALQSAKNELARVQENGQQTVSEAEKARDQAKQAYETYMKNEGSDDFDEAVAAELKETMEQTQKAYDGSLRERDNQVAVAKEQAAASAIAGAKDTALEQLAIDRLTQQEQLAKIEELIGKSGEVKAAQSGTVTQIRVTAGEASPPGAALLMSDNAKGAKVELLIGEDELKYVSRENEIRITGVNANGEKEERTDFQIAAVTPKADMQNVYGVTIRLPENVFLLGAAVNAQIVAKSQSYESCIPVSALYPEADGKYYVYRIGKSSTMLGETEVAKKMEVTVLDKNNDYAAIEESIQEEIITETNRDIQDGDRVRRME